MTPSFTRLALGGLALALMTMAFTPIQKAKKEAHYTINGVFCSGCVGDLKAVAQGIDGVEEVKVDIEERLIVVTFDDEKTSAETIREHINTETTFDLSFKEVKDAQNDDRASSRR